MCELCFGQDPEDLPPECDEPECPDGIQSCFDETDCVLVCATEKRTEAEMERYRELLALVLENERGAA